MTASPDGALLRVENLSISFNGADPIVRNVSFALNAGQCLAIVGESGSGKSVTARSLIGLTGRNARLQSDLMELAGTSLHGLSDAQWRGVRGKSIGFVLQDALVSLDPLRPVGREIEDALRLHSSMGRADRRARTIELLASVGVPDPEHRARQRSGELSGGLRQRALIASAVAMNPPLLVADEPTTALDATVQAQILQLLEELKSRGTAIILISHDLAVVNRVADQVVVMRDGEIVEAGPTAQILSDPQHDYTKRLIRAIPTGRPRGTHLSDEPVTFSPEEVDRIRRRSAGNAGTAAPGAESDVVLDIREVAKSYRNPDGTPRQAVAGVSVQLRRGRTLGIVGESGSGKTTVARMALGLVAPDSGDVLLHGQPWSGLREKDRRPQRSRIAAIYQDPLSSFDPQWTVADVLGDALSGSRLSSVQKAAETAQLLDAVGLSAQLARRSPQRLSGGQRQRVAIARALASGPEIIVCDEPVSALDVSVQAQVLDLLDELQRELALSYLFISHDLGVIQHVSDDIAVMRSGTVVEHGPTEQIFTAPAHEYTRTLLAAAPRLAAL